VVQLLSYCWKVESEREVRGKRNKKRYTMDVRHSSLGRDWEVEGEKERMERRRNRMIREGKNIFW